MTTIDMRNEIPDVFNALYNVEKALMAAEFDVSLYHLVKLRASQINQCAFCVDMHIREARRDGERESRLDRLVVWRHVDDFTPSEKAALAWTEALSVLKDNTDYELLRVELHKHFTSKEISALTGIIGMINLWNRLQVSQH